MVHHNVVGFYEQVQLQCDAKNPKLCGFIPSVGSFVPEETPWETKVPFHWGEHLQHKLNLVFPNSC